MDQRFGPGVLKYPDGREDVGLWLKDQLLRLCTPLEERFSLKNFPEYSAYMDPSVTAKSPTQVHAVSPTVIIMNKKQEARNKSSP